MRKKNCWKNLQILRENSRTGTWEFKVNVEVSTIGKVCCDILYCSVCCVSHHVYHDIMLIIQLQIVLLNLHISACVYITAHSLK